MKFLKKHKYVIVRLVLMALLFVIGLHIGRSNRKTKTVLVEIPVENKCDCQKKDNPIQKDCDLVETEYKEIELVATAYCPCNECSEGYGKMTATGTVAKEGRTVAVDPSVIPYGTELLIDGIKYIAEDCGGAVKGNKIDIYFDTHKETKLFGKKTVVAKIVEVVK